MHMRQMTQAERAEFAAVRPPDMRDGLGIALFSIISASLIAGSFAVLVLYFVLGVMGWPAAPARLAWAQGGGAGLGAIVFATGLLHTFRLWRQWQTERRIIDADMAQGEIGEEHAVLAKVTRLREPEHHTEMLILHMQDGRCRAVLDDSTTNIGNGRPKRSALRLARSVSVLHLTGSGRQITRFAGETVRRPEAVITAPHDWPEHETWLDPAALVGLSEHLPNP